MTGAGFLPNPHHLTLPFPVSQPQLRLNRLSPGQFPAHVLPAGRLQSPPSHALLSPPQAHPARSSSQLQGRDLGATDWSTDPPGVTDETGAGGRGGREPRAQGWQPRAPTGGPAGPSHHGGARGEERRVQARPPTRVRAHPPALLPNGGAQSSVAPHLSPLQGLGTDWDRYRRRGVQTSLKGHKVAT